MDVHAKTEGILSAGRSVMFVQVQQFPQINITANSALVSEEYSLAVYNISPQANGAGFDISCVRESHGISIPLLRADSLTQALNITIELAILKGYALLSVAYSFLSVTVIKQMVDLHHCYPNYGIIMQWCTLEVLELKAEYNISSYSKVGHTHRASKVSVQAPEQIVAWMVSRDCLKKVGDFGHLDLSIAFTVFLQNAIQQGFRPALLPTQSENHQVIEPSFGMIPVTGTLRKMLQDINAKPELSSILSRRYGHFAKYSLLIPYSILSFNRKEFVEHFQKSILNRDFSEVVLTNPLSITN